MVNPLILLENRVNENWFLGVDGKELMAIARQQFQHLSQQKTPPTLLLAERNSLRFIAHFIAGVAAGCPLFLGNPNWSDREWQEVLELVQPDIILGEITPHPRRVGLQEQTPPKRCRPGIRQTRAGRIQSNSSITGNLSDRTNANKKNPPPLAGEGGRGERSDPLLDPIEMFPLKNSILIPTGGTSGQMRFAIHTWGTLMASIRGFTEYFQLTSVNSFCVLPIFHVSGLMQFLRSFTTGGQFAILPSYKDILEKTFSPIKPAEFFISLVPTQMNRLLENTEATAYLAQFKTVLLGGAPAWPQLLETARKQGISLAPTYGMTETASQIVTLKPAEFLAGNNSCGRVLPHAKVTICNADGEELGTKQTGIITIQADSLAKGYYPQGKIDRFQSDDLGFIDEAGYLTVVGRNSDKMITGGENVFPAEVEAAILATGLVRDVCAIAIPDLDWGEAIAAVYVPDGDAPPQAIAAALVDKLVSFKRPKYWVAIADLPRNDRGKINRDRLREMILSPSVKPAIERS